MKKYFSILLTLALMLSILPNSVLAADISTSGNSGDVPVELTQEASTFSVTVTTVLPVDVDAGGVVTVSTNNKIINNSWGPVEVKSVLVEPQNSWTLKDFNTDFTKSKVGAKEFGFQINGENVSADGSCSTDTFSQIDGGEELNFNYDAIIAAQNIALEDVQIANVVFVIGWAQAIHGYNIVPLEDVLDDEGNVSMNVGESVQLSAVALYSLDTPTWESNNTSVVEVTSDGLATAVGVGTATITYTFNGFEDRLSFVVNQPYKVGDTFTYEYTGTVESINLKAGQYRLEAWGAQGSGGDAGTGGYSSGVLNLDTQMTLYICVGGRDSYNGGGRGTRGGGASHIATRTGLLSSLENYKDDILLVAGGGGGFVSHGSNMYNYEGGNGGGANQSGTYSYTNVYGIIKYGLGGTLLKGGAGSSGESGSFGQGGNGAGYGGGGGGGYYGGGAGKNDGSFYSGGGGGGSGYANTDILTSISGKTGGHSGNGEIKITVLK